MTVDDWTDPWCLVDLSPGQSINCSLTPGRAAQSSRLGGRGGGEVSSTEYTQLSGLYADCCVVCGVCNVRNVLLKGNW